MEHVFEKAYSCKRIAEFTGGTLSEEAIRAACHRAKGCHRLPHIKSGTKRPVIKIRWSDFTKWYEEEIDV